jgi:hypothetical protein
MEKKKKKENWLLDVECMCLVLPVRDRTPQAAENPMKGLIGLLTPLTILT